MKLFNSVVREAGELIGADRSVLFVIDGDRGILWSQFAEGMSEKIEVPLGKGIVGCVAKSGEAVIVNDVRSDARFDAAADSQSGYTTTSILCVPVFNAKNSVLGVLEVLNKSGGSKNADAEFTDDDKRILEIVSHQVGVALEAQQNESALHAQTDLANAELEKSMAALNSLQEQLDAAERSARLARQESDSAVKAKAVLVDLFGTLELESLIHQAMTSACELVGGENGTIYVVDGNELWVLFEKRRKSSSECRCGIPGHVAKTGDAVSLGDAYLDSRFDPCFDQIFGHRTRSLLCVRARNATGDIVGVVQVINKPSEFTDSDRILLHDFADHLGLALENAFQHEGKSTDLLRCMKEMEKEREALEAVRIELDEERRSPSVPRAARCAPGS